MQWIKNNNKKVKEDWHLWFAWRPVIVTKYEDGNEKIVWGETILRRFVLKGKLDFGMTPHWIPEHKECPEQLDRPNVLNKPTESQLPKVNTITPMPDTREPKVDR